MFMFGACLHNIMLWSFTRDPSRLQVGASHSIKRNKIANMLNTCMCNRKLNVY